MQEIFDEEIYHKAKPVSQVLYLILQVFSFVFLLCYINLGGFRMTNRVRKHGIYLMLSDDELEILENKYKLSGCKTLRQFIMKCVLGKDIFVLDMTVFRELSASVGRITGSINQIAKRVNSTGVIYKEDILDIKELLQRQGKDIYSLRKKLYELGNLETVNTEEV